MKLEIKKERTHLFAPSINIAVMVSFAGKLEDSLLYAAVQTAVKNNEVLRSKITISENGDAFYETNESRMVVLEPFDGEWSKKVIEQEKKMFDIKSGELIRFFIKKEEEITQLIIIAHHLVSDGLGITYFVEDILNTLNGKKIEYKKQKLYNMSEIPTDSKLNPFMQLMLENIKRKWNKTGKVFTFPEYARMFRKYWNSCKTQILTFKLEERQLDEIEKLAKLHNISINSILTTIFLKVAGKNIEIGIPVSLREKDNQSMANYATAISIKYRYNERKEFWKNANDVHKLIYAKLDNNKRKYFLTQFMNNVSPTLIDAAYFAAYDEYSNSVAKNVSKIFGYSKIPTAISLSNLTRIMETQEKAFYKIKDYYFVPPIVPNTSCIIGVVTYNKQMIVTFHAIEDGNFKQKSDFFDRAMKELFRL